MSHFKVLVAVLFLLSLMAGIPAALADGGIINLKMAVEKEIKVTDKKGVTSVKRITPKLVLPGDEVIYTIRYSNDGKEDATDVVIKNPIPVHVLYTAGSAQGENTEIRYSVDGGTHFDAPDNLTITTPEGEERPATESDYTHIRWTLQTPVAPNSNGQASYRARVR